MAVTLEVLNTESNIRRVVITRTAVIGRGKDCGLRIASSRVSRRHCELILGEDGVRIRDLGSSNGTFVNNKPLVPGVIFELDPDDQLRLGSVRMKVTFEPIVVERPILPKAETDEQPDVTNTAAAGIGGGALAAAIAEASDAENIGKAPQLDEGDDVAGEAVQSAAESAPSEAEEKDGDSLELPELSDEAVDVDAAELPTVGEEFELHDEELSLDADEDDPSFLNDDEAAPAASSENGDLSDGDDSAILDFLNSLD